MTGGVYHIGIPAKCRIQGVGFAISGMARRSLRITVPTKTITVKPFHLVSTVTQRSVARHLDSPHWAALGRVENIRLASFNDTPDDTSSITWGSHVSHVSWATMIIVMCIIVVLICVKVLQCVRKMRHGQAARRYWQSDQPRGRWDVLRYARRVWRRRRSAGVDDPQVDAGWVPSEVDALPWRTTTPASPESHRALRGHTLGDRNEVSDRHNGRDAADNRATNDDDRASGYLTPSLPSRNYPANRDGYTAGCTDRTNRTNRTDRTERNKRTGRCQSVRVDHSPVPDAHRAGAGTIELYPLRADASTSVTALERRRDEQLTLLPRLLPVSLAPFADVHYDTIPDELPTPTVKTTIKTTA